MQFFNYNGKIYKAGTAVIKADNRGLRYGDGLFETMRYNIGQLEFADEHFARLWNGMQLLQFEIPRHFDPPGLQEQVIQLLKKNGHENSARVRLTVFRADGGLYDPINHVPQYIIETWELNESSQALNSNGLILGIYEDAGKSMDLLSNLKHNNYLPYVMGALKAKKEKWNDALILNSAGRICESTIANVFIIKDKIIYTPDLKEGCVAGVLRKALIRKLVETGFTVIEKQIDTLELMVADEVFLTNSIYRIRWVQRIGEKLYSNKFTTQIFRECAELFSS